jgi:hypothetical protein
MPSTATVRNLERPMVWNNTMDNVTSIWFDEAEEISPLAWSYNLDHVPHGFSWGPNGYGDPADGFWRNKEGHQIHINTMEDSYLLNCMKFLDNKFGNSEVKHWKIYKKLMEEAIKRGIDGRPEWDR